MKVYVLYILSDYAHAVHMSIKKQMCERELADYRKRGGSCHAWIEEYDFAEAEEYELDCD
jgi:hypothetical protein